MRLIKPAFWLWPLALWILVWGPGAWGEDFTIGSSTAPNDVTTFAQGNHMVYDTTIYQYTAASSGDSIYKIRAFFRSATATPCTMAVAIYAWNVANDSATSRLYLDTIIGTHVSGSGGYDSVYVGGAARLGMSTVYLTSGTKYTIAAATLGSVSMTFGYIALGSGTEITNRNLASSAGLTDPYTWTSMEATDKRYYLVALGGFGAVASSALVIGGSTVIGGSVVIGGQ